MTTTVKVLHLINMRDNNVVGNSAIIKMLGSGAFCDAGEVEVLPNIEDDIGHSASEIMVLESAWVDTQNDTHPNYVDLPDGNCIGSFQALVAELGGYEAADKEVKSLNGKILPAVWNDKFAQRSSTVGDLFIVGNRIFRAMPGGFRTITTMKNVDLQLGENPYTPTTNNEFDALVFVGE